MKKLVIVLTALFFLIPAIAMANGGGDKITVKDNNVLVGKGNTGIQGNKNHHNTIIGGDVVEGDVINGPGKVVNKNTATAEGGSVKNSGNSHNLNLNIAKGGDAKQGQKQKQEQDQSMTNEINIEGDTTYVEADKREHIQGAGLMGGNAQVVDTKASNIRTKGDLLSRVDLLTMEMAKRASKNASDMEVEPALLWENDFQTKVINVGFAGEFAGYIYIFADGSDCYLAAMDAEAAEVAMKNGFTHIRRLGDVETSKVLDGSAWNIGISGGASIMSNNEDLAIAPQGGLGYGNAKSASQYRPDAVYEVSFSKELIEGAVKSPKAKYNYTVADR